MFQPRERTRSISFCTLGEALQTPSSLKVNRLYYSEYLVIHTSSQTGPSLRLAQVVVLLVADRVPLGRAVVGVVVLNGRLADLLPEGRWGHLCGIGRFASEQ